MSPAFRAPKRGQDRLFFAVLALSAARRVGRGQPRIQVAHFHDMAPPAWQLSLLSTPGNAWVALGAVLVLAMGTVFPPLGRC